MTYKELQTSFKAAGADLWSLGGASLFPLFPVLVLSEASAGIDRLIELLWNVESISVFSVNLCSSFYLCSTFQWTNSFLNYVSSYCWDLRNWSEHFKSFNPGVRLSQCLTLSVDSDFLTVEDAEGEMNERFNPLCLSICTDEARVPLNVNVFALWLN